MKTSYPYPLTIAALFAATSLSHADPALPDCGTQGTTDARVAACATAKTSKQGFVWKLVSRKFSARSSRTIEVWLDTTGGLVWGDSLSESNPSPQDGAIRDCASKESAESTVDLADRKIGLPGISEFIEGDGRGLREILPNIRYGYWSSSPDPSDKSNGMYFDGKTGGKGGYYASSGLHARCVGRL
jgi:hypothetical protein